MKKFIKLLFSFIVVCGCLLSSSFGYANYFAKAEESTPIVKTPLETMLSHVVIAQDGYVFSYADFEKVENQHYLYVNTTLTITYTGTTQLRVTIKQKQADGTYTQISSNIITAAIAGSYNYSSIDYNQNTENVLRIELNHNGVKVEFELIQTPSSLNTISWVNQSSSVILPTASNVYNNSMTLNGISGTENLPVYIDFYYNGEFYGLYHNGTGFYNRLTNNQLQTGTSLTFTVPGQYQVYIYDKTCYKALQLVTYWPKTEKETTLCIFNKENTDFSPYAHTKSYSFYLKNSNTSSTDNLYIVATDNNNNTLASGQKVNSEVFVQFFNLADTNNVKSIMLYQFDSSQINTNILKEENLLNRYTVNELVNGITISEDSSYRIVMLDQHGNQIGRDVKFTVLTKIHTSYGSLKSTNRELVPESNVVYPIPQTSIVDTSYAGFTEINDGQPVALTSSTSTDYNVLLARAAPSIDGVEHGIKYKDSASVTVNGVGDLVVYVTHNGSTKTYYYQISQPISVSEVGDYTITVTDQMGTTLSKSFSVSRSYNTATMILLGVVGFVVVLVILIIVRTRTTIKVR